MLQTTLLFLVFKSIAKTLKRKYLNNLPIVISKPVRILLMPFLISVLLGERVMNALELEADPPPFLPIDLQQKYGMCT